MTLTGFRLAAAALMVAGAVVVAAPQAFSVDSRTTQGVRALDPDHLPALPADGLVVADKSGVLLIGLDGSVYGKLVGLKIAPGSSNLLFDAMVQQETGATYPTASAPLLVGRGGVWMLSAGHLIPLRYGSIPLPGGAEIVGHATGPKSDRQITSDVRDTRTGKILASGSSWFIADGRLLVEPRAVLDLVTRARWQLPSGVTWGQGPENSNSCTPAGLSNNKVIAVCGLPLPYRPVTKEQVSLRKQGYGSLVRLFSVEQNGKREPLGLPFRYGIGGAESAFLSPDGAHVAATLSVPCGLSPSIIAPTHGGEPRYIDGDSDTGARPHNLKRTPDIGAQSYVLGWSANNQVVAEFEHGECINNSTPGIYLIDPTSFHTKLVYVLPAGTVYDGLWTSAN